MTKPEATKGLKIRFAEEAERSRKSDREALNVPREYSARDGRRRHENAAGKKTCGMCGYKAVGKWDWSCTNLAYGHQCPAPNGKCGGFAQKPRVVRSSQIKPARLNIPPGVHFLYFGRPRGSERHQGVMTVAYRIHSEAKLIVISFSFCSPQDPWVKAKGQDLAIRRLQEIELPLQVHYLYEPQRLVIQIAQAVAEHRFQEVMRVCKWLGPSPFSRVPGWSQGPAKRYWSRVRC